MQALVAYFTTMQERDYESAARLRSVASAFTNVAITFLRNYRRHTTTGDDGGGGARKRHRPLDHDDDLPDLYPPASSVVRKPAFTGIIATTTAANARAPTTPPEATDLQTAAAFLRWQGTTTQEAVESSAAQGLADIEMLIAEPLGFQMRMELGGPLDFDWFGWEEAQSLGDEL